MKRIMVNISEEEMALYGLNEGSGSEDIKRLMGGSGGDMKAVMDRLDKLALLFMEMNKKLSKPEIKVQAPDYGNVWDIKHDPLANMIPAKVEVSESKLPEDLVGYELPQEAVGILKDDTLTDGDRQLSVTEYNFLKENGLKFFTGPACIKKRSNVTMMYHTVLSLSDLPGYSNG